MWNMQTKGIVKDPYITKNWKFTSYIDKSTVFTNKCDDAQVSVYAAIPLTLFTFLGQASGFFWLTVFSETLINYRMY